MSDKSHSPLSPFLGVLEGLPDYLEDRELQFLVQTGYMKGHMSGLVERLDELADIRWRAQCGDTLEGDAVRAMRLLLSFSKPDLVRILMETGLPSDEEAFLPWRLELHRRTPSRNDQVFYKVKKKIDHRFKKQHAQDSIVRRIIMVRQDKGVSLEKAYEIVAKGEDLDQGGILGQYLKPRALSVATVKSYYMAGMKRLKPQGYVDSRAGPIFGGGYRRLYFGDLTRKGRRPRKK